MRGILTLTDSKTMGYNKGNPVRCGCGQLIAYEKDDKIYLYCKKCKRQIPIKLNRARA